MRAVHQLFLLFLPLRSIFIAIIVALTGGDWMSSAAFLCVITADILATVLLNTKLLMLTVIETNRTAKLPLWNRVLRNYESVIGALYLQDLRAVTKEKATSVSESVSGSSENPPSQKLIGLTLNPPSLVSVTRDFLAKENLRSAEAKQLKAAESSQKPKSDAYSLIATL